MKIQKYLFGLVLLIVGVMQSSCSSSLHQTQIRYMPVVFDSLHYGRDFTIDRDLNVSATIEKNSRNVPRARYIRNYRQGVYEGAIVPSLTGDGGEVVDLQPQRNFVQRLFVSFWRSLTFPFRIFSRGDRKDVSSDPGLDLALYELFKKYPNYDYFANLRIERETLDRSGNITEIIKLKAYGLRLFTDDERQIPDREDKSLKEKARLEEELENVKQLQNELRETLKNLKETQEELRKEKEESRQKIENQQQQEEAAPRPQEETQETLEGDEQN